jgi:hypothetical protein
MRCSDPNLRFRFQALRNRLQLNDSFEYLQFCRNLISFISKADPHQLIRNLRKQCRHAAC